MKLITPRTLIRGVAARWGEQYGENSMYTRFRDKLPALQALDVDTCTPADVEAIIGNPGWTTPPECDECGASGQKVMVQVGDEPDYESATAHLCLACVRAALALLEAGRS